MFRSGKRIAASDCFCGTKIECQEAVTEQLSSMVQIDNSINQNQVLYLEDNFVMPVYNQPSEPAEGVPTQLTHDLDLP